MKEHRWLLGFALEAQNPYENALQKLRRKHCDWIVLNGPAAIGADDNSVELIDGAGDTVARCSGSKAQVARTLVRWVEEAQTLPAA
jgi:phosphopantothenoylcysteine decarboxylase/phosphopantothenate--cysteine ligase